MKNNKLFLYFLIPGFLFLSACEMGDIQVATGDVINILPSTADATGYILSAGDGITHYGHCYAKTSNPTVSDLRTEYYVAIGEGNFTSSLQLLEPGTTYYIKAYAGRKDHVEYGSEISFTTPSTVAP